MKDENTKLLSLLLSNSRSRWEVSKLSVSRKNSSKSTKYSEYSREAGGNAKFKPLNVVIQKSDKGNSGKSDKVDLTDEIVYTNGIKKLLDNPRQFEKLSTNPDKKLSFILNCEQRVIDILQEIKYKNQINEGLHNKLRPVGSQPGALYDVPKVHKKVIDGCPVFRPILSAIGHPRIRQLSFLFLYLKI